MLIAFGFFKKKKSFFMICESVGNFDSEQKTMNR